MGASKGGGGRPRGAAWCRGKHCFSSSSSWILANTAARVMLLDDCNLTPSLSSSFSPSRNWDTKFRAQRWIEGKQMIHGCFKLLTILLHCSSLPQLHKTMHLDLKLLWPKFFFNCIFESWPGEPRVCLTKSLKLHRC